MINPFDQLPKDWMSMSYSGGGSQNGGGFATLQTPTAQTNAANSVNAQFQLPSAGSVKLPDWLSPNADSQMSELLSSYSGIQSAFDPTAQVEARNNAIGYNTAAGGQAANNAASEYATRAQQSGGSALGAGVVKAQSMMPVLQQNAQLKTEAADVAAKSHQEAANLAAQVANTIGNLRTSYLQTLTGFVGNQQQLGLEAYKANQQAASGAADREFQYAQLREQQRQSDITASRQRDSSGLAAAQALLASKGSSGSWTTDNRGNVTGGQPAYNNFNNWQNSRTQATNYLGGLLR